ncbi:MAG: glutaredoxin 2 [Bdellovibrionales bacterium]|nr:glutaredoxin 2 [Bdellovibrionales bacterium]
MSFTLYHYVHCPFCVRVRMAFGYLNLEYESKVVPYDDETTPVKLTGKKMLPIMTIDKTYINESLEIISTLDKSKKLKVNPIVLKEVEDLLAQLGNPIHSLAMPYWIFTPEFTNSSRAYFQKKKEEKRGPFSQLVKNQSQFVAELNPLLTSLEKSLTPFYKSSAFGLPDIMIAAHLWGLYVVPEFQFSEKIHHYLQSVKKDCRFNYHQDFWS